MTSPRDALPTVTSNSPAATERTSTRSRVLLIFGTRPEAIKLCPLVRELRAIAPLHGIEPVVCVTGQHRKMLDQVLEAFDVRPDLDLNLMQPSQSLSGLTSRLIAALEPALADVRPSIVVVQGDTTTTLCGALAAFYAGVPVAHVEAGLRTFDSKSPFPEEMNRLLTSRLSSLHFAATPWAARNLEAEGVPGHSISVTGNTGIDAVLWVRDGLARWPAGGQAAVFGLR